MTVPMLRCLHLARFRSLPSATVELDNPTFLVGENGTGKSNVADAFAFLADAMTSPLPAVFERRGGIDAVGHRSSPRGRPSELEMKVVLENLDEETNRATYEFKLRSLKRYEFEVVRERCVVEGRNGSRNFLARDGTIFRSSMSLLDPVLKANALALPLAGGDRRFAMVLQFLSEMCVYRIESAALREMQNPDAGSRLRSDGSNAASVLRRIERESPDDWQTIRELLESIVPGTIGVDSKKHGDKLSLEFTQQWPESKKVRFKAYNMSDGTLRALGLLTAVFQCPAPSVLVLEEPEATMLHPDPETPRGAKENLEARMNSGTSYLERTDQPALSAQFSMAAAHTRSRSFRKLTRSFGDLLDALGQSADPWPPVAWTENR